MIPDIIGVGILQKTTKPEEGEHQADGGTGGNHPPGCGSTPEGEQFQPQEDERRESRDHSEQADRQGYLDRKTLNKETAGMDSSIGIPRGKGGAVETMLTEFSECRPCLVLLCEIPDENANAHSFVLGSLNFQGTRQ
jgi:hypothetical protein